MDGSTIMRNMEEKILGVGTSCFHGRFYKERYGAKYLGWPVVRYL